MAETVAPPDAETHVIAHLTGLMSVPVRGYRLGDPDGPTVIVRTTGGSQVNIAMWWVQLTISCWAATPEGELEACTLARAVVAEIQRAETVGAINGQACTAVEFFNSPYPDPDPVTHRARYSTTFRVLMHGTKS